MTVWALTIGLRTSMQSLLSAIDLANINTSHWKDLKNNVMTLPTRDLGLGTYASPLAILLFPEIS